MLSRWDDYPIHQSALPIAHPAGSDEGRYERYWLTMFDRDLSTQLGFGLSVHPNRGLVDAALSITRAGRQDSVFASASMDRDRSMTAGPLRVEVVEPMRTLRIVLEEHDGLAADLTFHATTQCIEDSYMLRRAGTRVVSERTRTVQFGAWSGSFLHQGKEVRVTPENWLGARDRSWGSRSTGTVSEHGKGLSHSTIWFTWVLAHFPDSCLLAAVNETSDGIREARTAVLLPHLGPGDAAYGDDHCLVRSDEFEFTIDYQPGTRRAATAGLTVGPRGPINASYRIVPEQVFFMKGLGYGHPLWPHGKDHGGLAVGSDGWLLADLDPTAKEHIHVEQLSRVTRSDGVVGLGVLEHIAIGAHTPSGLPDGLAPREA